VSAGFWSSVSVRRGVRAGTSVNDDTTVTATAKIVAYCRGVATRTNYRGGGHLRNPDQVSRRVSGHRVRVGTLRDGLDQNAVASYHAKHRAELRRRGVGDRGTNGRLRVRFTGAQIVPVITDESRRSVDRGVEPDFIGAGDVCDIGKELRTGRNAALPRAPDLMLANPLCCHVG